MCERGRETAAVVGDRAGGRRGRVLAAAAAGWRRLRRISPWTWGLVGAVAAFTWYFTHWSLDIHHGLGTATYDFALYDQGVWLLSRFKEPFITLMGRNLLGDHTSFILLLLVPAYWVAPGAGTLFFSQAFAAGLSAVPLFLYARHRLGHGAVALLIALLYLLNPALHWAVLEGFHPDLFLAPLLMFAVYGALTERWRVLVISVLLALLVKEDVSLVVVPLGVWVAVRKDRMIGLAIVGASIAYTFFAVVVMMRGLLGNPFPNAWRIPFGGVGGFLHTVFTRPGDVLDYLVSGGRPWYLWQMLTPFAWLMARLPEVALISAPVLLSNIVSTFGYQHQIRFHYTVAAVPGLALGTAYALGAFRGRARMAAVTALAVASLWTAYLWGPLPWSRGGFAYWAPDYEPAVAAREIIASIPDDAVVSAHYRLTPHLARRRQIYSWPNPFFISMYGTDVSLEGRRLPSADAVEYVAMIRERDEEDETRWAEVAHGFVLLESNQWWELYRRTESVEPVPGR